MPVKVGLSRPTTVERALVETNPSPSFATVDDCRQALRLAEWELLRLKAELGKRERTVERRRRAYMRGRRGLARSRRKCRDLQRLVDLMRDLIGSNPAGGWFEVEEPLEPVPAGLVLLERLGELLKGVEPRNESSLQSFFVQVGDLQDFAKDLFDYAGIRLVYELEELLGLAREAPPERLEELFQGVSELRDRARQWFVGPADTPNRNDPG